MKDVRMDGHKLYWHIDRVLEWQNKQRIAPLHVDFGIATGCNMGCSYCYGVIQGRDGKYNGILMPKETILNFLSDAKQIGIRSVAFIGEGENTLNPALYDSLAFAKEIKLDVGLATNGIELQEDKIEILARSLTWLRFNFSAYGENSFYNIHKIKEDGYQKIIANIKKSVKIKKLHNLDVTIGMQMVVTNENINDIVPLSKLAKQLGVDYFVVKPTSDTFDRKLKSLDDGYIDLEAILSEAESHTDSNFAVIIKWNKMMNGGRKDYKVCNGTQFIIAISGNGNVFPCGHWFNIRQSEFLMGNINTMRFSDIVASQKYWDVQERIQSIDVIKDCETNCRQHYVNQFLDFLLKKPEHINFI